jgi:hypothetical protein
MRGCALLVTAAALLVDITSQSPVTTPPPTNYIPTNQQTTHSQQPTHPPTTSPTLSPPTQPALALEDVKHLEEEVITEVPTIPTSTTISSSTSTSSSSNHVKDLVKLEGEIDQQAQTSIPTINREPSTTTPASIATTAVPATIAASAASSTTLTPGQESTTEDIYAPDPDPSENMLEDVLDNEDILDVVNNFIADEDPVLQVTTLGTHSGNGNALTTGFALQKPE